MGEMKYIHVKEHFCTITRHKLLVMHYCFAVGMYKQGLLHDLSKYGPTEFLAGCRYYQGTRSPNNEEREENGVSLAWLHHKGRNRHHYEYWIDYKPLEMRGDEFLTGMYMPTKYVVEMFFDRLSACRNYQGENYTCRSALIYYENGPANGYIHPDSRRLLEHLLKMLAEHGEEKTLAYIRKVILPNAKRYDQASLARFKKARKAIR